MTAHDERVRDALALNAADLLAFFERRVDVSADAADLLAETMMIAWRRSAEPEMIVSGGLTDVDRPVRTKAKSLRGGVLLSLCGGAEVAQANLFRALLNSDRGLRCL
ncbi:hypothetical protein [Microbacterium sp. zg-YB36]|uniref:hypothetical protein n=1 Tax=Microbacterium sp. zg-YB36 TaxID=2969407 RepID=UPI00214BCE62|nr:hypothetical protein [Microbacterium sp. zg-YB36]MDL5351062.1 hypothetical protein [Microbacterium sp. zg-YB36]